MFTTPKGTEAAQGPSARTASVNGRFGEVTRFGTVGALSWVVDVAIFNVARVLLPASWVLLAKVAAVFVAATFSWVMNRRWTFREGATSRPAREFVVFLVVNTLGLVPPLLCLWVSHYLLGFTSVWADNVSANVVGLVLGALLRYFGYRHLVFTGATRMSSKRPQ